MITAAERERRIQRLLDRMTLTREEAEEIVAIDLGESFGDIEPVPPLTLEERKKIGLGLSWEEAREQLAQDERELAKARTGS